MQLLVIFGVCVTIVCVESGPIKKMDFNNKGECGVVASNKSIHHDPWLVYLEYYKGSLRTTRGAATLIGPRHAVTAAHCVKGSLFNRLVARLGDYDLNSEVDSLDGITADPLVHMEIEDIIVHEGYDKNANDIAIIVFKEDAPYTDFIRPVCLPNGEVTPTDVFTAAGWGELPFTYTYAHVKKTLHLPYWSRDACQNAYKNLNLPQGVICAGGEDGIDTCRGDSGGPLTLNRGKTELWGVTSSGNVNCGTKGFPGIYTSIKDHLEWVYEVVARTS